MTTLLLLIVTTVGAPQWEPGVWQNLNAGAGGNIQSITLDPNTPDRLYLCSDMEGLYRSDDAGLRWSYLGRDLSWSYTNQVTVEPGQADRLYVGTERTIEISDDAGGHWRVAPGVADSIGAVLVDPVAPAHVWALPGKRHRWAVESSEEADLIKDGRLGGPWGERTLYLSRDRGQSWRVVRYADGQGRRDILSAQLDPGQPGGLLLGTLTGLYASADGGEHWTRWPSPTGAGDGLGAALSADGAWVYACFQAPNHNAPAVVTDSRVGGLSRAGRAHLFVARRQQLLSDGAAAWNDLSASASGWREHAWADYMLLWRPRLAAPGDGASQRLLVGEATPQHGLWEVAVDLRGARPSARWRSVLDYPANQPGWTRASQPWDIGWEAWGIAAEDYHVAPASWPRRWWFATGGQTLFRTDGASAEAATRWEPIYTRVAGTAGALRTYRTRGFQSEFVFDGAATGVGSTDYAIAAVGDNALHESFDGGWSWTIETKPGSVLTSRANAVTILDRLDPPVVLAHAAIGWGAGASTGTLWAKRLRHRSPEDRWVAIAGGEQRLAGVPNLQMNQIVPDPRDPRRAWLATFGRGIYELADVPAMVDAAEAGRPVPAALSPTLLAPPPKPKNLLYEGTGLSVDPSRPDLLWAATEGTLWRGERLGPAAGDWLWRRVPLEGFSGEFALAAGPAGTRLMAAASSADGPDRLVLSTDDGASWRILTTTAQPRVPSPPAWQARGPRLRFAGLVAEGDRVCFALVTGAQDGRRASGCFSLDLATPAAPPVDLTADLPWPYPVKARLLRHGGQPWLYLATRGNGLWRRSLP